MENATIVATKNLYNGGKCFKKGKEYQLDRTIAVNATLMDMIITNDLGQPHQIGNWWRSFEIVDKD